MIGLYILIRTFVENEGENRRKPNFIIVYTPYITHDSLKFNLLLSCNVDLEAELIHKKEVEEHQLILPEWWYYIASTVLIAVHDISLATLHNT